jgi:para-nitrobenzyl esterase
MAGTDPPQEMAERIHGLWTRFATDGQLPWPAYSSATRQVCELASGSCASEAEMPAARFVP